MATLSHFVDTVTSAATAKSCGKINLCCIPFASAVFAFTRSQKVLMLFINVRPKHVVVVGDATCDCQSEKERERGDINWQQACGKKGKARHKKAITDAAAGSRRQATVINNIPSQAT